MSTQENPNCDGDHCRSEVGEVRLLPVGGSGNAILCNDCFNHEMRFRRERIKEGVEFDLPRWEDLKIYSAE